MTLLFTVNQTPATGAVAMFTLKEQLKTAGWTIPKSSDGTTYNSSGDQISSGGSGANGMDNARAWFVVQMPSSSRSFCIQRNSTTGADTSKSWRIKYSKGVGFTGGSPSATVTPTATDEVVLLGAGTDASPTFAVLFFSSDGFYRFHCCADNASPYSFLSWSWASTTGITGHAFGLESLLATAAEDTDPYLIHLYPAPGSDVCWKKAAFLYGAGQMNFWNGSVFYRSSATLPAATSGTPTGYHSSGYETWGTGGDNLYNGKDDLLPLTAFTLISTAAPLWYYKGVLSITRAICQAGRYTGYLYSITTSKDGIAVGNCVLPWDGSSTPLI